MYFSMANLSQLILTFQQYYAKHGDLPVVFRGENDHPHNILSTGLCEATDVADNDTKVCWVADRLFENGEDVAAKTQDMMGDFVDGSKA